MFDAKRANKIGVAVFGKHWLLSFFLALLTLRLLPAQSSSQIPDHMYPVINDAGRMSIAAYGNDKQLVEMLRQEGWGTPIQVDFPSGLHTAIWERNLPNGNTERIVAFVGTKDAAGVAADLSQGLVGPKMTAQYRDGLDFALRQVAEKDQNAHLTVTFTGHSLGGGIAEQVNLETGVRAVVFNAAPLNGLDALLDKTRSGESGVAATDLWNLRTKGDIVSALPLASQYGRTFAFDTVRPTTGQWAGDYSTHGVEALLDSVNATRTTSTARELSATSGFESTKLAAGNIPRADLVGFSGNLSTTAKMFDLQAALLDMKKAKPILSFRFGAKSQGLSLSAAVLSDIDESRNRSFNVLQSHTLEQFGSSGIWALGSLSSTLSEAGNNVKDILRVSKPFASKVSWLASTTDIGTDVLKFSLSPNTLSGKISLTDGLAKGATYLTYFAASRPFVVAAAALTGPELAAGLGAATVASTAINLAAEPLRDWTWSTGLFQRIDFGSKAHITAMYHDYTRSQAARGKPSLSYDAWLNPTGTAPRDSYTFEAPVTRSQFAFTAASGRFINGTSAVSQIYTFHISDLLAVDITTRTSTSYTESSSGAAPVNRDIERSEQPARQPGVSAGATPPLIYNNDTVKRPPSGFISSPLPPRSQPNAVSNSDRDGKSPPQVKGVLMPANVTTKPVDVTEFLKDK